MVSWLGYVPQTRTVFSVCIAALCLLVANPVAGQEPQPEAAGTTAPPESTTEAPESTELDPKALRRQQEGYRFGPDADCPYCIVADEPVQKRGLHWHQHWSTVGTFEYVTIAASAAAGITSHLLVPPTKGADWTGPILFDDGVRNLLVLDSEDDQSTARTVSDALMGFAIVQPMLIDNLAIAWLARGANNVAYQMMVINLQAYSLTIAINGITKRLTNRQRPWAERCDTDEPTTRDCDSSGRYQSFYSGHAAFTATGAGLVCAHHTQLLLYDDPVLDTGACLLALAGTATTGALRISSDNHWASDVVIGHLAGYLSGYLMPTLLYYKEFSFVAHEHDEEGPEAPSTFAVLPMATDSSVGLWAIGIF